MVIAEQKFFLNKETILSRVTEYDILRAFWPSHRILKLNTDILSPFREEKNPSFIVGTKFGYITYKDMGNYNYRGDIWHFVKQIEGLADHNSVLLCIDSRMGLGISDGQPTYSTLIQWEQPKIEIWRPPDIKIITRNWNKDELSWWNQYHQDISDLKREEIYVPKTIYRNKRRLPMKSSDLIFCYWFEALQGWKIYRPLKDKKSKNTAPENRKWDSNIPFDYIEHLDKIKGCKFAYVNKSRKDRMVLRKALGTDCICTLQAEDPSCLNEDSLLHIKNNSEIQVITSDNDKKGKELSWWLTTNHGYKHCNVPDPYLEKQVTDFADMSRYTGTLDTVREHFKLKGLL